MTLSPMLSADSTSIYWIIRFGGNAGWSLITSCNQSQEQFPSL